MEPTVFTTRAAELAAVRARRAELRGSLDLLERALAAPAAGRAVVWGEAVHAALVLLADDFGAHVEVTEGPAGLHEAILAGDLRLANAVEALRRSTRRSPRRSPALVTRHRGAGHPGGRGRPCASAPHCCSATLVRHRQRGADLIYEAYETDIGGGD